MALCIRRPWTLKLLCQLQDAARPLYCFWKALADAWIHKDYISNVILRFSPVGYPVFPLILTLVKSCKYRANFFMETSGRNGYWWWRPWTELSVLGAGGFQSFQSMRAHRWGQAPADPIFFKERLVFTCFSSPQVFPCHLDCSTLVSLSTESLALLCWIAGALLVKNMLCCGLGKNILREVGKTAIGRLLPLWNVTCTPKPTARLRKLLWIFNILVWSWPQFCIS